MFLMKSLALLSLYKKELYSLIGLLIVAFGAPALPKPVLLLLDNVVVNIVLVLGILFAITHGPVLGIMALMAVAMLYMERNRTKVAAARTKFNEIQEASDPAQMTVEQEGIPQDTVDVREFAKARPSESIYLPGPKVGDDDFDAVLGAPDLNQKHVQPTVPLGEKSAPLFKNYLG
jgi:hypothetical protein